MTELDVACKLIDIIVKSNPNYKLEVSCEGEELVNISDLKNLEDVAKLKSELSEVSEAVIDVYSDSNSYMGFFYLVFGNDPDGSELMNNFAENDYCKGIVNQLENSEVTVMDGSQQITHPGFVNHNKFGVFVNRSMLISFTISNILRSIPVCQNNEKFSNLNKIREDIITFLDNNEFSEYKFDSIKKTDPLISSFVRLSVLESYVTALVHSTKSISDLNLSVEEHKRGITDITDVNRDLYSFTSRYNSLPDESNFIDLGALVRNIINDFIYEDQLTQKKLVDYNSVN